jgi:methionyl-tRNA formyltransferase
LVVVAFGALLGKQLLNLGITPPINVHPSLLPRHRGPAPINWAIVNGDERIGVTIMYLEEGMDTGPILSQSTKPLVPGVSALKLSEELAREGAAHLMDTLRFIKAGIQASRPQDPSLATTNRLLTKKDGYIDFDKAASTLASLINGLDPWPAAQALLKGKSVKFFGARAESGDFEKAAVKGLTEQGELVIGTGEGLLMVKEIQMEGKNRVQASEFMKGYRPVSFSSMK